MDDDDLPPIPPPPQPPAEPITPVPTPLSNVTATVYPHYPYPFDKLVVFHNTATNQTLIDFHCEYSADYQNLYILNGIVDLSEVKTWIVNHNYREVSSLKIDPKKSPNADVVFHYYKSYFYDEMNSESGDTWIVSIPCEGALQRAAYVSHTGEWKVGNDSVVTSVVMEVLSKFFGHQVSDVSNWRDRQGGWGKDFTTMRNTIFAS